jgi:hypothetical protein
LFTKKTRTRFNPDRKFTSTNILQFDNHTVPVFEIYLNFDEQPQAQCDYQIAKY